MGIESETKHDEKGLSARYLVLVFLMGVAACAVFFSLGFLVGYNERASKTTGIVEQVTPSTVIPPTVNPPLENVRPTTSERASASARERFPERTPSEAVTMPKPSIERATPQAAGEPAAATISTPDKQVAAAPLVIPGATPVEVHSGFTVQVAASRDKQDAEKLVKELKSRGYAVFMVVPEFANASDNLFRVQVGPFATREDAEKVRSKIAKEGFKPYIRH